MSVISRLQIAIGADWQSVRTATTAVSATITTLEAKIGAVSRELGSLSKGDGGRFYLQGRQGAADAAAAQGRLIETIHVLDAAITESRAALSGLGTSYTNSTLAGRGLAAENLRAANTTHTLAAETAAIIAPIQQAERRFNSLDLSLSQLGFVNYRAWQSMAQWHTLSVLAGPGKAVQIFDSLRRSLTGIVAPARAVQFAIKVFMIPALGAAATALMQTAANPGARIFAASLAKLAGDIENFGGSARTMTRIALDATLGRLSRAAFGAATAVGTATEKTQSLATTLRAIGGGIAARVSAGIKSIGTAAYDTGQKVSGVLVPALTSFKGAAEATQRTVLNLAGGGLAVLKHAFLAAAGTAKIWSPIAAGYLLLSGPIGTATAAVSAFALKSLALVGITTQGAGAAGLLGSAIALLGGTIATVGVVPFAAGVLAVALNLGKLKAAAAICGRALLSMGVRVFTGMVEGATQAVILLGAYTATRLLSPLRMVGGAALGAARGLLGFRSAAENASRGSSKAGMAFRSMLGPLAIFGALGTGIVATASGLKSGFDLANAAEQNAVAFETMLGPGEKTKQLLLDIEKFSAATPFQLPELNENAKKLVAFGVAADQVLPTMRVLGDLAQGNSQKFERLGEIYGKAKVTGGIDLEDIKSIGAMGIPIFEELGKAMGRPKEEVKKLISEGKVGLPQLQTAFVALTKDGAKFGGGMAKQSQTVNGLLSTLSDSVGLAFKDLVAGAMDALNIKGGITNLSEFAGYIRSNWVPKIVAGIKVFAAAAGWLWGMIAPYWNAIIGASDLMHRVVGAAFAAIVQAALGFGAMVAPIFSGAGTSVGDFSELVTVALLTLEWGFQNWQNVIAYALLSASLGVVVFAADIAHFFTAAMPEYIMWFARNATTIFADLLNATNTIFDNLVTNVIGNMKSIWDWIMGGGTGDLALTWKPLLDGFKSTTEALPTIAARAKSELETSLESQTSQLGAQMNMDFEKFIVDETTKRGAATKAAAAADAAVNPAGDALKIGDLKVDGAAAPGDGKDAKKRGAGSKKEQTDLKAAEVGSAEAYSALRRTGDRDKSGRDTAKHTGQTVQAIKEQTRAIEKTATQKATLA